MVSVFILVSTIIFLIRGNPVGLLVWAGAVNGLILPLALAVMLIAASRPSIINQYKHSITLQVIGWIVVAVMSWMGWQVISKVF